MSAMMPGETVDTSVLEEFTTAKRKIGEIFEDIDQQVEAVQVTDERTRQYGPVRSGQTGQTVIGRVASMFHPNIRHSSRLFKNKIQIMFYSQML